MVNDISFKEYMKESILTEKNFNFAIRIINLYKYLLKQKKNLFYRNNCCEVELLLVHSKVKLVLPKAKLILFTNMVLHKRNAMNLSIG